jgi:hypothetical protein
MEEETPLSCCSDVMKPIDVSSCCTPQDTAVHAARYAIPAVAVRLSLGGRLARRFWGLVERSLTSGTVLRERRTHSHNTRLEPSRLAITCIHVAEARLIRSVGRHRGSDE